MNESGSKNGLVKKRRFYSQINVKQSKTRVVCVIPETPNLTKRPSDDSEQLWPAVVEFIPCPIDAQWGGAPRFLWKPLSPQGTKSKNYLLLPPGISEVLFLTC